MEKAVYQQSKHLIEKGVRVLVIHGNGYNRSKRINGIQTRSFKTVDLFNGTYPVFGLEFAKFVFKNIKENPSAKVVIHARHVFSSLLAAIICKLLNRNYILVEHTADTSFMNSRLSQALVNLYEKIISRFVVQNAEKIIAVSPASQKFLYEQFEVDPSKVKVITNGFDPEQIGNINLHRKENIVLFASKWIKVKDPVTTFAAFRKLSEEFSNWEFVMVGQGSEEIKVGTLPRNFKLLNSILKQEDFLKILKKSKVYVNSSLSEGFPLAVAEAAGAANLLVLSDAPTNKLIAHELNQTDYLFKRADVERLVESLRKAIKDSENLENLKQVRKLSFQYSTTKIFPEFAQEVLKEKEHKKLSIVIPVYNEQRTIQRLLNKIAYVNLGNAEKEIIIIDDGSKDKSIGRIDAFIAANPNLNIKLLRNKRNIGKSQTVKRGLLETTGDLVVIQDADLEYAPKDLAQLVSIFRSDSKIKVVYGNRFHKENEIIYPHFYFGNLAVTAFANLFTLSKGLLIKDMEVCYKMFEGEMIRETAKSIESTSNFGFEPEVTAIMSKRISRREFRNVNISYVPRTVEEGKKIRVVDGLKAVKEILRFNLSIRRNKKTRGVIQKEIKTEVFLQP